MANLGAILVEAADTLSTNLLTIGSSVYGIVDAVSSNPVVTPDTIVELEYKGERRISTFPVEQGAFSSYDKVAVPFDLRMVVACGGQSYVQTVAQALDDVVNSALGTSFSQPMSRDAFIAACEAMLDSTDLYDVITPDATYTNVNLVHFGYRKRAHNGAVMLLAELGFQEVRQTVAASYSSSTAATLNSASPSAANPQPAGTLTGSAPSTLQGAQISVGGTA